MDDPCFCGRGFLCAELFPLKHPAFAPLFFLALALIWSWPAAISGDWVGRYSDTPGTLWTLWAAPRLLSGGLHDTLTAWPTGIDYSRPDSYILLIIGTVFQWVDTPRLHAYLQIVGLAGSAWAAEACARALGVSRPAALIAGMGYVFGGLGSTVLLEGHVYQLLNPWLPLLVASWWRATGREGRLRDGVGAAIGFTGALLSTAYLGVAAAVLLGGLLLGAFLERRRQIKWGPLGMALAIGAPVSAVYSWFFMHGAGAWASQSGFAIGAPTTLLNLLGPTDIIDGIYHSQVTAIPTTVLALFLVAPVVLQRQGGWRRVAVAGLVALIFSMGSDLQVDPAERLMPLPMALLSQIPGLHFLHFPARIGWGWGLCAGLVAAQVAGVLIEKDRRVLWGLALCLGIDSFVWMGMPFRQRVQPAEVPSVYFAATGPVLDLFPLDAHQTRALDLRAMTLACAYQMRHHRPIADVCITTSPSESPRARLGQWLWARSLEGASLSQPLGDMGFSTVVLHADLYRPQDRERLMTALSAMDPQPLQSRNGGEWLLAYTVPVGAGPVEGAWTRWMETP